MEASSVHMRLLLKRVLRRELQNSRIGCALNDSKRRRTKAVRRVAEVCMIQQIEELKAQLEPVTLAKLEKAGEVRVHIHEARSDQRVITGVAILTGCIGGKCSGTYPHSRSLVPDIRIVDYIRAVLPHAGKRVINSGHGGEREPGMG